MKICVPNIPTIKKSDEGGLGPVIRGGRLFEVKACGVGAYSGEDSYKNVCA